MVPGLLDDPLLRDVPTRHGFKVLDPCVLYDRIGEGGMGAVYRGEHLNLGIDTAVKVMKVGIAGADDQFVARFQREAMVAASINHAGLIRVFDVKAAFGLHYIVMELVRGETLRQRVRRKGPLSPAEACAIARAAAEGLGAAHAASVIHRDIKPDNVLVSAAGEVKVLDLGLAKGTEASDTLLTQTRRLMGTPQYMAPEQFDGAEHSSPRSDVHALGSTLAFMLLGRDPHPGSSVTQIMKSICLGDFPDVGAERGDVPEVLLEVLRAATARDAAVRPANAGELARRLSTCEREYEPVELADPAASQVTCAAEPPSKSTISALRAEGPSDGDAANDVSSIPVTVTGEPGVSATEPTVPPPGGRESQPRRRLPVVVLASVAVVLVAAGGSWAWLGFGAGGGPEPLPAPKDLAKGTEVGLDTDSDLANDEPETSPTRVDPSLPPSEVVEPSSPSASSNPLDRARDALAAGASDEVLDALVEAMAAAPDAEAAKAWDELVRDLRAADSTPERAHALVEGRDAAWRTLAEAGSAEAEVVLAEMAITYSDSDGIELTVGREDETLRRLVAAANAGHSRAWFYLGDVLCQVPRFVNGPLATSCYDRAAKTGCADGLARLAHRHLYELMDLYPELTPDEQRRRGRTFARDAAQAGSVRGMYWHAQCLLNGVGGGKDERRGRERLEEAARRGHPKALEACADRGIPVETAKFD